jgi:WhiB family redox-sensing transcriptional regulator
MMGCLDQAACLNRATDDFFPDGVTPLARRQAAAAKQACIACPVRDPCLAWALETGTGYGVWGGLTEKERRSLEREEQRRADELSKAPATST